MGRVVKRRYVHGQTRNKIQISRWTKNKKIACTLPFLPISQWSTNFFSRKVEIKNGKTRCTKKTFTTLFGYTDPLNQSDTNTKEIRHLSWILVSISFTYSGYKIYGTGYGYFKTRMCPKYTDAPLALSFTIFNGPWNWVKNLIWP